ncbi:endo alpha-1,4 polygalactosaminidase [Phototrophicus methaneseepsis]|uniref:Endo alpha-1,4 polygalactosaminidase n=1 Tax=Phototrophicus methaneseepsis TaxID=2710758 RepID=A0A7S8EAG4_9CHLR|nr:MJ1477/TM1410 family putative glycoside hydrolase [Phototrophicus methaneseepsis]QPC83377.1 endo alpha-1,4 polygalactosaminidase [Phototrophicus methaneseepsis]
MTLRLKKLRRIVVLFSVICVGLFSVHIVAQEDTPSSPPERDWQAVNDYIIQLQRARAERLAPTAYDLVIADIALAGNSPENIEALRHSEGGDKLVVAYMSIGQAATFQYYWQPEWRRDSEQFPDWADEPDGMWAGDIWVHYWDPQWQEIILTGADAYLDRIIDMGFDGVLLDRVDAATYYEEQGRETAYAEMVDFVMAITEHARTRSPEFGVFTINGEDIPLRFPESGYMEAVTGILVESLHYGYPRDNALSDTAWTAQREAMLDEWVDAGKLVLVVDYSLYPEHIADAYTKSRAHGYIPYAADRSLGRMLIHEGHEPD